ncbi:MAG: lipid-A-disaccharide synthase [Proteobacteria bacterium]|nr:lipid-A-disaccharide synthase [Pseudomonadota bacterium]
MNEGTALVKPVSLMLISGEPSGDQLGGELMSALKSIAGGGVTIAGVGGRAMERQGLKSLYPLDATAVMGLAEVVPQIPEILRRVRVAADFAISSRPDAVVLIDSPDFTHRIAKRIKRLDSRIMTVNYVAPQVWASRQYRARKMARYIDLVLALFPFEVPFFEKYGIRTKFVGHPVIERAVYMRDGPLLRAQRGIASKAPLLLVVPGSRINEIRFILPVMRQAVERLAKEVPGLATILPAVAHVAQAVREQTKDWPTPLHVIEGEQDRFAAFDAADVALAKSGTVTAELALARKPMVVVYKLGWLTYALYRPLISVKYAALPNLLLDREALPELMQSRCTPENIVAALKPLFLDSEARAVQLESLDEAAKLLGRGEEAPSLRAARALLDFVHAQRLASGT